jgi:hypothetical protein
MDQVADLAYKLLLSFVKGCNTASQISSEVFQSRCAIL